MSAQQAVMLLLCRQHMANVSKPSSVDIGPAAHDLLYMLCICKATCIQYLLCVSNSTQCCGIQEYRSVKDKTIHHAYNSWASDEHHSVFGLPDWSLLNGFSSSSYIMLQREHESHEEGVSHHGNQLLVCIHNKVSHSQVPAELKKSLFHVTSRQHMFLAHMPMLTSSSHASLRDGLLLTMFRVYTSLSCMFLSQFRCIIEPPQLLLSTWQHS